MNKSKQAKIDRAISWTEYLWRNLPERAQDEMRTAIENHICGNSDADAGFYFPEVGEIWPKVQRALDNFKRGRNRCKIYREWTELCEQLHDPEKQGRFIMSVTGYAICMEDEPDFSDDEEISALWAKTNVRPYDAVNDRPGWVKVWKRNRRTGK